MSHNNPILHRIAVGAFLWLVLIILYYIFVYPLISLRNIVKYLYSSFY
jgi:hypothetical protein